MLMGILNWSVLMKADVLRYLGYGGQELDERTDQDLDGCMALAKTFKGAWLYKILHRIEDENLIKTLDFDSRGLEHMLEGCDDLVIFAATLGQPFERLTKQWAYRWPSKSLILDACGSDRIESFVEAQVMDLQKQEGKFASLRYSPGYGDFHLSKQGHILKVLEAHKKIGIAMNASYLMMPSKSITGVFGLSEIALKKDYGVCDDCQNRMLCDKRICRRVK